ncbi:MAG: S8 family serine peptidase [Pyrinomonadaceae bacterium]
MSELISVEPSHLHTDRAAEGHRSCPVCRREAPDGLTSLASLSDDLQMIIAANAPSGVVVGEVCGRCVELFNRAKVQLETRAVIFEQGGLVLPTPLRLDADERFTGRGMTIACLDSGFYPHSDLTIPDSRILAYHSIVKDDSSTLEVPDAASWHGMMTSVVAAGNGALSGGFYRGIAPDANVVLVKLSSSGRISERHIKGLEW